MNKRFFDASVFLYCFLLIVSCMSGLFLDLSSFKTMGFLGVCWALLSLLVFLWVIERVFYYKKQLGQKPGAELSRRILSSMQRQHTYNQGIKAVRAYNATNVFILICGTLYCLWMLFVAINPAIVPELVNLNVTIEGFFQDEGQRPSAFFDFQPIIIALLNMAYFIIILLSFWMIQLYVHSNSGFRNVSWIALALFFLSFFSMLGPGSTINSFYLPDATLPGYGWSNIDVMQDLGVIPNERLSYFQLRVYASGLAGAVLLYLPAFVVAVTLIRNMFSKSLDKRLPLIGLLVLCVLLYVDVYYTAQLRQFSLWVSGWCILGIVSIRERSDVRKIYRIHQ